VADIGAAFLVAGLALGASAWQPRYWPAGLVGAAFLALHRLIHLRSVLGGHSHHVLFDLLAVVIPSGLALYSTIPSQVEPHA
jgi:hypothetical protein